MMNDWKDDLEIYLKEQKKTKRELKQKKEEMQQSVKLFMQGEVLTAFEELKKEFKKHKREVEIDYKKDWAAILIKKNKHKEFVYEININMDDGKLLASKSVYLPNDKGKLKLGVEGKIRATANSMQIARITKDDVIADFLEAYKSATRIKT
jgi:ATP-dependent 26S proteasome regulatory subunit